MHRPTFEGNTVEGAFVRHYRQLQCSTSGVRPQWSNLCCIMYKVFKEHAQGNLGFNYTPR